MKKGHKKFLLMNKLRLNIEYNLKYNGVVDILLLPPCGHRSP